MWLATICKIRVMGISKGSGVREKEHEEIGSYTLSGEKRRNEEESKARRNRLEKKKEPIRING